MPGPSQVIAREMVRSHQSHVVAQQALPSIPPFIIIWQKRRLVRRVDTPPRRPNRFFGGAGRR